VIKGGLKFLFTGGILFWLYKKGDLDFSLILKSFEYKLNWVISLILLMIIVFITSYRWKLLLEIKAASKISIVSATRLTWLGLFFSAVLPGSVTGDLVKLVYAKDLDKKLTKTYLVMSALLDRIIGLSGLFVLLGIFSVIFYSQVTLISTAVTNLIHFNFLLFGGVIGFLCTLFLSKRYQEFLIFIVIKIPMIGIRIENILNQFWVLGEKKKIIFFCLFMSMISQTLNIIVFLVISAPFINTELSYLHAFTFIPIGFVTMAIPVAPGGLGVGNAAFSVLFSYYGVSNGASLFNLFFIVWLCINICGSLAYIFSGKKHKLKEAQEFE